MDRSTNRGEAESSPRWWEINDLLASIEDDIRKGEFEPMTYKPLTYEQMKAILQSNGMDLVQFRSCTRDCDVLDIVNAEDSIIKGNCGLMDVETFIYQRGLEHKQGDQNQFPPDEPNDAYEQMQAAQKHRESLFAGMNEYRLREQLLMAHDVMTELLSIPFVAGESKMGAQEREQWEAGLLVRLKGILRAEDTCLCCGARYPGWEDCLPHECNPVD